MNQKAVIFDMDGVLVHSEDAMKTTAIESLRRFGINPTKSDFVEFTGMGEDAFIGGVAGKYGLEYTTEMKDYAYMLYVERARELVEVFDGVKEVLLKVRNLGLKVAVASAADLIKVRTNLACIGLDVDFFDALVTGSDVEKKKPDPEIFQKAALLIGIIPENCMVVEDAKSGIMAAKAAGMSVIGITTSFSVKELETVGPDYIVNDIKEAYKRIADWKSM
ncbi:MAG TPA: HAD-IA family hydrolase [Clostridia bacterium]|nr:HAD-IA family hydrolase [Clostridia bacterium]HPQ46869.1 HAD-IA family hydrolase [Clostridia bacterium]HRX41152.1 HAD-IA family hydrolase [Clostridia bacterium]